MGPWSDANWCDPADLAVCREAIRDGSRSFFLAGLLLPRGVRQAAHGLYAWCRAADDAIDLSTDPAAALVALHGRLDALYAGHPADTQADRAMAGLVRHHHIPRALPAALLDGFAWDAAGRRYATLDALEAYAARVAGTVGAMMAMLMGARAPQIVARACELGIAMQLSNILRDIGEDARRGRLYLPLDLLAAEGIDAEAFLAAPVTTPALRRVIGRILARAEALYQRATPAIGHLPLACRPAIHTARTLYAAIGEHAGRAGFDPVIARAVVPGPARLRLVARALAAVPTSGAVQGPVLPAAQFVVDSVPHPTPRLGGLVWLLELFERLERAGMAGLSPQS